MGRSFMLLLMLIIVFLFGMLFGVEKNDQAKHPQVSEVEVAAKKDEENEFNEDDLEEPESKETSNKQVEVSNHEYLTHKTASLLEKTVKSFYNIIVEIMYQFSKMFF